MRSKFRGIDVGSSPHRKFEGINIESHHVLKSVDLTALSGYNPVHRGDFALQTLHVRTSSGWRVRVNLYYVVGGRGGATLGAGLIVGRDPTGDAGVVEAVAALGDRELVVELEGVEANGALLGHGESAWKTAWST
jgi:hypothetical protein